jgi:methanogenic corrinoid protein MtbC1
MENYKTLTKDFLEAILKGDRTQASNIVNQALADKEKINNIYENIIKPALYKVGEMWESGIISVATEHLASAIVESVLNELYYSVVAKTKNNKTVVATAVENEVHQIGIKMVSDIFEINGWNVHYLGANTPSGELLKYIDLINPAVIALSVSIDFHLDELKKLITMIKSKNRDLLIITGGQGLLKADGKFLPEYPDVMYIPDLYKLETFINQIDQADKSPGTH